MAVATMEDLLTLIAPGQTIAGIDLGTETIGLAVSDLSLSLASPRPVIRRKKFNAGCAGACSPLSNATTCARR